MLFIMCRSSHTVPINDNDFLSIPLHLVSPLQSFLSPREVFNPVALSQRRSAMPDERSYMVVCDDKHYVVVMELRMRSDFQDVMAHDGTRFEAAHARTTFSAVSMSMVAL